MSAKHINFKAIAWSLIFLLNPNIGIIDIFPDFIGYILLSLTLVKLSDINDTISEALKLFKRMIFIDAAKILAIFWVFGMSVSTEKDTSLLLWSFIFSIFEMIFVIPAFVKLFTGLTELAYVYDNVSILGYKRKKSAKCCGEKEDKKKKDFIRAAKKEARRSVRQKNYTDKVRAMTVSFIIVKALMSVLPEFSNLTAFEYYENPLMNLYEHIGTMRFLAFIPVLIVGLIWFVKLLRYFARVAADDSFNISLNNAYANTVLPKRGIFVKRNIAICFVLIILAAIFSIDFRLENINMLPDFISAIAFILFFYILGKRTAINRVPAFTFCGIYFLSSIAYMVTEYLFFNEFYYGAVYRSEDALLSFTYLTICACVNSAAFLSLTIVLVYALKKVIYTHVGSTALLSDNSEAQKKMNDAVHAELSRSLVYLLGAAAIYVCTDIAYALFAKDFGFMLIINLFGAAIFIATLVKTYYEISEAVTATYILE